MTGSPLEKVEETNEEYAPPDSANDKSRKSMNATAKSEIFISLYGFLTLIGDKNMPKQQQDSKKPKTPKTPNTPKDKLGQTDGRGKTADQEQEQEQEKPKEEKKKKKWGIF